MTTDQELLTETNNFSGTDLSGKSFAGRKDLVGANFSNCIIRGTNFSDAKLEKANFSGAIAGLQIPWIIILLNVLICTCFLLGLVTISAGTWVAVILANTNNYTVLSSQAVPLMLVVIVVFYVFSIKKNFFYGLSTIAITIFTLLAFASFSDRLSLALYIAIVLSLTIITISSLIITWIWISSFLLTDFKEGFSKKAGIITSSLGLLLGIVIGLKNNAGSGAVAASFEIGKNENFINIGDYQWIKPLAFTVAILITLLSGWIANRILPDESKRDVWIKNAAKAFASIKGTNFTKANLTDTNFEKAFLLLTKVDVKIFQVELSMQMVQVH